VFFAAAGHLLLLCGVLSPLAQAQNFRPFTPLQVLPTKHFDLIFPEGSRSTAETLATFADTDYDRVSGFLGISVNARIPVTITPDTDEFNGYSSFIPYVHIVLFDTPLSLQWTAFDNNLEKLFLHELTHAISLSTRTSFWQGLNWLFGSWVSPALLTAPGFMVEGVAVSLESQDGSGRSNDPLVRERVIQAIRENNFLSPFQASGAYDDLHSANGWYEYGGLFSSWLQMTFGNERYAKLWQAMGSPGPLGLDFTAQGFFGIFREVYGRSFDEFWADFADSIAVRGLAINTAKPLVNGPVRLSTLASGGDTLAALDSLTGAVKVWTAGLEKAPREFTPSESARDLDVAQDGHSVLVSGFRYQGSLAEARVQEYSSATGASTGRTWKGLWSARYFREGVVGLGGKAHVNRLVWRDEAGKETVLLEGDEGRSFSAPAPIDQNQILFLVAEKGRRKLGVYDFRTGTASYLNTDMADDAERWAWARDLRACAGKVWFSWDSDGRTYRPGFITLAGDELEAVFGVREFSGGVHSPVSVNNQLVYRATYTGTDSLLTYPQGEFLTATLKASVSPLSPPKAAPAASESPPQAYWGIAWFNPLLDWYPAVLFDLSADPLAININGAGVATYLTDPSDMNVVSAEASWNWKANLPVGDLKWTTMELGFPLISQVEVTVENSPIDGALMQVTRGKLLAGLDLSLGSEALRLLLTPKAVALWAGPVGTQVGAGLLADFNNRKSLPRDIFERGESFTWGGDYGSGAGYRLTASAKAGYPWGLPIRVGAYGFYDATGATDDGYSMIFGASEFSRLSPAGISLTPDVWAAGGAFEWQLITVETQTNLSLAYFNRLFLAGGWGVVANSFGFRQAAVVRVGAVLAFSIGGMSQVPLVPTLSFSYTPNGSLYIEYDFSMRW